MSHLEEREEKICLNCNAQLYGRFCHVCGQENLEPKESFWHLLTHFIYDVTHFDGKFFSTLKYLLLRPGKLATEYLNGRRANYLHPIRMYVFASAIFFVVFFSLVAKPEDVGDTLAKGSYATLDEAKQELQDSANATPDSAKKAAFMEAYDAMDKVPGMAFAKNGRDNDSSHAGNKTAAYSNKPYDTAKPAKNPPVDTTANNKKSHRQEIHYNHNDGWRMFVDRESLPATVQAYDSLQQKLPAGKRDGWFSRMTMHRLIEIQQKYHGDDEAFAKGFWEKFVHSIPQMMFVSVPFVALVLQLLYVRRRKQFFYVNHVIFIIYVYIAVFTSLLVYYGLGALLQATHFSPFEWLQVLVMIYIFLYCFLAMHNFYKQGYVKSFFKYFILLFICLFLNLFIVSFFAFTSLMSV